LHRAVKLLPSYFGRGDLSTQRYGANLLRCGEPTRGSTELRARRKTPPAGAQARRSCVVEVDFVWRPRSVMAQEGHALSRER
jgi:hypothetical protein